jgi:hypothetical protein
MVAVSIVQVTADNVVGVVAVGNGGMTAIGGVSVASGLFARTMSGSALDWICGADGQGVVVHMAGMGVVQMAGVEVVGVAVMLNGGVTATGAVLMWMRGGVLGMCRATGDCEGDGNEQGQEFFHFYFGLPNKR